MSATDFKHQSRSTDSDSGSLTDKLPVKKLLLGLVAAAVAYYLYTTLTGDDDAEDTADTADTADTDEDLEDIEIDPVESDDRKDDNDEEIDLPPAEKGNGGLNQDAAFIESL